VEQYQKALHEIRNRIHIFGVDSETAIGLKMAEELIIELLTNEIVTDEGRQQMEDSKNH